MKKKPVAHDYSKGVFYDASKKRLIWLRSAGIAIVLAFVILVAGFLLSLGANPQFPALLLPQTVSLADPSEGTEIGEGKAIEKNSPAVSADANISTGAAPSFAEQIFPPAERVSFGPLVFGFYVNWDPASLQSLKMNIGHLTHLVPEWFFLEGSAGAITDDSDEDVIRLAKDAHVSILALLSNYHDGWNSAELHRVLRSPQARHRLESNILDRITAHDFAGVNVDFEQLPGADRYALRIFLRELRDLLRPKGLLLTQDVQPEELSAYDLKRFAELNDYVVPMLYDQHFQSGRPGAIASHEWFARQLKKVQANLPAAKTIIAIGNYGYDWAEGSPVASEVRFQDVLAAANLASRPIEWDAAAGNPVLHYEASGQSHEVWFLDAVTAWNEMRAMTAECVRGAALWRLGSEDPGIWKVLASNTGANGDFQLEELSTMDAPRSVQQYGQGEIIKVIETSSEGHRNVWRIPAGEHAEQFLQLPSNFVLGSYGHAVDKRMALTFDDGPDSRYTPAILDILKAKHVPAAFFVVGSRAEMSLHLVKRMFKEGHTIGNHTYLHPDMSSASETRTRYELSVTQRLIEDATGRATTLFRPPFQADSEPRTPAELSALQSAQAQGYTMVGAKIDPRDWEARSSGEIVQAVLRDKDLGNIVVLHDGGGDRSSTVAALPQIIDALQAQGYRFVSVGDLLGKTRSELMPRSSAREFLWAKAEGGLLVAQSKLRSWIGAAFLFAIGLTILRTAVYGTLCLVQKKRAAARKFDSHFAPPVSIIIAAYNEEKVIVRTVQSILDNGYRGEFEVIVVDDGSQDATLKMLEEAFASESRVRIHTQPNRGKAVALNQAIAAAQHEILVTLDADTLFAPGTIAKLARHFVDPDVAGVSANIRVGNRGKWITRLQSLEYIYGFNLDRRALDALNAVTVIPGAASAWRRSVILQSGGYTHDTVAEDTDLTLAIRRHGYVLRYDEEAIAYTEAPETVRDLVKQRLRWAFGTLQAAWKHRDATFNPKYGTMAFVTLPSIWVYQVMLSMVSPTAEIALLLAVLEGSGKKVLAYYLVFLLLEFLTGMLAYALEKGTPDDLLLLPFQRIFYPHLMLYVVTKSGLSAMSGKLLGWSRASRHASVQPIQPEVLQIAPSKLGATGGIRMFNRNLAIAGLLLPFLFAPKAAHAQGETSRALNSPESLYDDATLLDPGTIAVDVYNTYTRTQTGFATSIPGFGVTLGLNSRLELSASSGITYGSEGGEKSAGLDDTYAGLKVLLLSQGDHRPAIAVKPALEVLSNVGADPLLSSRRANFVMPLLIQQDMGSVSASYTGGYINRGVAFSVLKLEGNWRESLTPLAVVSYSQITKDLGALKSLGLNRRQVDASLGLSKDINSHWSVFVQAGRTIGRVDANGSVFECTVGISFTGRLWGRDRVASPIGSPIHF